MFVHYFFYICFLEIWTWYENIQVYTLSYMYTCVQPLYFSNMVWPGEKWHILLINRVYIQTWKDLIIYVANYKRGTCAEEVCNFIALHRIIKKLYCLTFRAIYSTNAKQSDAHMQKGSIKNYSIVELYNKVKIIQLLYMH